MAGFNSSVAIVIGGAIGASLGTAISGTKDRLQGLQREMDKLNARRASVTGEVAAHQRNQRQLLELRQRGNEVGAALEASRKRGEQLRAALEKLRLNPAMADQARRVKDELRQVDGRVAQLSRNLTRNRDAQEKARASMMQTGQAYSQNRAELERLNRELAANERRLAARNRIQTGRDQVRANMPVAGAIVGAATAASIKSADYQAIIRDIAIKGGIARSNAEIELSEQIRRVARENGMARNEMAEAVNALVATGMSVQDATAQAPQIAKFTVGQNAESTDVAKMIAAFRLAGVQQENMQETLGRIAVAGDLGSFEARDMAKHFPALLPQMTAMGVRGEEAVVLLSNMLQTQMLAAGSSDEAANNLANMMAKFTSNDSVEKFGKQGIDLAGSMRAAMAQGYDPMTAFVKLVQEASRREDPDKAREMAELQERIRNAQDPESARALLDGYVEMAGISELVSDRQAKQAVLAAMRFEKQHEANLQAIRSTDGVAKVEKDLADRRAASKNVWAETANAMDEAMTRIGDALRPLTDVLGKAIGGLANGIGRLAGAFPIATAGVLGLGAAFATWKSIQGVTNIVRGAAGLLRVGRGASVIGQAAQTAQAGARTGLLGRVGQAISKVPGLNKLAGAAGIVSAATAQPVFVTNWPVGGLGGIGAGVPDVPGGAGSGKGGAGAGGKKGALSKLTAGAAGVAGMGKAALAAPSLSAIGAMGAGTVATSGAMVAGAGLVGYGVGKYVVNPVIDGVISATTGRENSLGTWLYEKFNGAEEPRDEKPGAAPALPPKSAILPEPVSVSVSTEKPLAPPPVIPESKPAVTQKSPERQPLQAEEPRDEKPGAAAVVFPVGQSPARPAEKSPPQVVMTFSPTLQLTVQGDVKEPRKLAEELMPHLKRMFDNFSQKAARGDLFDPAHA
jgi:hypothetical protein